MMLPLRLCVFVLLLLSIAACETRQVTPPVLPTLASMNSIATDTYVATHAPPSDFDQITLAGIDDNLEGLSGWRYELRFTFDGIFSGTERPARYSNTLDVSYNQVRPARRVVATIDNDIQNERIKIKENKFIDVKFDENYKFTYNSKNRIKSDGYFVMN
ncbi:MAG: hypothetical protein ACPG7F_01880, partial [Aggregatilineales bacterium]